MPDAELLGLPDVGHVAHLERPTVVAAAMRTFLGRLGDRRRPPAGFGEWASLVGPLLTLGLKHPPELLMEFDVSLPPTTAVGRAGRELDH